MKWMWSFLAWPVGGALALYSAWVRMTSRIQVLGEDPRATPALYVNWHRYNPFLIVHHGQRRRWMMVSSAPYMAPIAKWCELCGLKLARGASGSGGREALSLLQHALQRGESVAISVDGPAGPPFVVKPGCVELARAARIPIVPVAYRTRRGKTVKRRWDQMLLARAFDEIVIEYGAPIFIREHESTETALQRVQAALQSVSQGSSNV